METPPLWGNSRSVDPFRCRLFLATVRPHCGAMQAGLFRVSRLCRGDRDLAGILVAYSPAVKNG
jgi:hypothetical protein